MKEENREKPQYKRKLSFSQIRVLHNLCLGHAADHHIKGMSQRGAWSQTANSLIQRDLIEFGQKADFSYGHSITMKGVKAHRGLCCKDGRTEDDELADNVHEALGGDLDEEWRETHQGDERGGEESSPP